MSETLRWLKSCTPKELADLLYCDCEGWVVISEWERPHKHGSVIVSAVLRHEADPQYYRVELLATEYDGVQDVLDIYPVKPQVKTITDWVRE